MRGGSWHRCLHSDISAPNANELVALVEGGLAPAEAIRRKDLGEIAVGATADFVVVDGDPLKNPELLARPALVLKAGRQP